MTGVMMMVVVLVTRIMGLHSPLSIQDSGQRSTGWSREAYLQGGPYTQCLSPFPTESSHLNFFFLLKWEDSVS